MLTGGCQCGAVRYEVADGPRALYVCHCRECRKQSASAFGISVVMAGALFRLLQGTIGQWSRPTESGRTLLCHFCVVCGSRVWHARPDGESVSVKGGSLDEPVDLARATHIWTSRKLPGVVVPAGAASFPGEPD